MLNPLLPRVFWGMSIGLYLFLGGLAGGSYVAGAAADLLTKRHEDRRDAYLLAARWSMVIAVVSISIGGLLLLAHLGQPENVIKFWLFTNFQSWMTIGVWVIVVFTLLAALQALWLGFGRADGFWFDCWPLDRLAAMTRPPERIRRGVTGFGALVGVLLVVYTALLLSVTGEIVPLWDPTILPLLFLTSGLSMGIAATFGVTVLARGVVDTGVTAFSLADDVVILAEIGVLYALLATLANGGPTAVETHRYILTEGSIIVWGGVVAVGLVLPLLLSGLLLLLERRYDLHERDRIRRLATAGYAAKFGFVIFGGLMLRLVIVLGALSVPIIGA